MEPQSLLQQVCPRTSAPLARMALPRWSRMWCVDHRQRISPACPMWLRAFCVPHSQPSKTMRQRCWDLFGAHAELIAKTLPHVGIKLNSKPEGQLWLHTSESEVRSSCGAESQQQQPDCKPLTARMLSKRTLCFATNWSNLVVTYSGCPTGVPRILRPCSDRGLDTPFHTLASGSTCTAARCISLQAGGPSPARFHTCVLPKCNEMRAWSHNSLCNNWCMSPTLSKSQTT